MSKHQVTVDAAACIGCGLCVKACPARNMELDGNTAHAVLEDCILCGQCVAVCPKGAVSVRGYEEEPVEREGTPRLDPQSVLEVIRFRRTVRQFQEEPVPEEVLAQILEAGRLTHTAKNLQDVSFVVLDRGRSRMEALAVRLFRLLKPFANLSSPMARRNPIDDHFFFFHAPLVLVILAKDRTNGLLAAQNMEFLAEAHGLGVLYSGFFTMAANLSPRLKKALAVPRGKRVAMTLVLGYPKVNFLRSPPRKPLDVTYL